MTAWTNMPKDGKLIKDQISIEDSATFLKSYNRRKSEN